ncbi:MAG: hypothetical protein HY985_18995 [Magnetospirillum sp.]|nr:hypothetical protein [Magnetospirillum sp.]
MRTAIHQRLEFAQDVQEHILAAARGHPPDHIAFPPLAVAIMELGIDPLHAGEIQSDSHSLGREFAHQLLRHQRMGEQAVIEGVGTGHAHRLSRRCWAVTGHRQIGGAPC